MVLPKFIKLSCGTTTRKIKFPKCFDKLVLHATKLFPNLLSLSKNNKLTFFYVYEDKEIIAISNNDDFEWRWRTSQSPRASILATTPTTSPKGSIRMRNSKLSSPPAWKATFLSSKNTAST